ncbi:hypothetical protein Ciccas_006217 [Cichlidogyrus casuarinus]|uniref:Uncharacterized protein n=1 Tax=Cichlidogyrus casuarinus TaxID=1844966 RepID=A0ABD2Q6E0_9PLAT
MDLNAMPTTRFCCQDILPQETLIYPHVDALVILKYHLFARLLNQPFRKYLGYMPEFKVPCLELRSNDPVDYIATAEVKV